jgi:hypothetical protein
VELEELMPWGNIFYSWYNDLLLVCDRKREKEKITCMNNLLGIIHSRDMATTCTAMIAIENLFDLFTGEIMMKNSIDSFPINGIINDEISRNLMSNMTLIVM